MFTIVQVLKKKVLSKNDMNTKIKIFLYCNIFFINLLSGILETFMNQYIKLYIYTSNSIHL